MKRLDILVAGVGGQGVILASDIIGDVALADGYDVKKTDTIGMAQRGGSVVSHIRVASQVWSPLIKEGEADIILGLEKLEAARWGYFLKPGGVAVVNNYTLPPPSVNSGSEPYPGDETITGVLKQRTDSIYFIDGTRRAQELGNIRTYNTLLLGCVSRLTTFKVETWKECISHHLAPGLREINLKAFEQGRKEIPEVVSTLETNPVKSGGKSK